MRTSRTSARAARPDRAVPHLILVGLPGAGKTTVGRAVAEKLGRPFLDFDEEIVRREGMSIAEIFALKGEGHFRELERRLTKELAVTDGMVVAPGGGWIANADVVRIVRPPATLVYLEVSPAVALARLGPERRTRPLLQRPEPLSELTKLLTERRQAYATADATVSTELLSLQEVISTVAKLGAAR
jgi:shikimate kinase